MARVAIIGGGIGGLTAARALGLRGFEVAIYEAAPELREIGAGVALHPNAMKVLRSLGLESAVRDTAGRSQWAVTRNGKTGRLISKTNRQQIASLFGSAGATVHRADLLDVLAYSLPSHLVTLGKRCTGVESDGSVAVARFEDGTEVEADVVLGADGIHSAVRASLFALTLHVSPARSATAGWFRSMRCRAPGPRTTTPSGSGPTARSFCTPCAETS